MGLWPVRNEIPNVAGAYNKKSGCRAILFPTFYPSD